MEFSNRLVDDDVEMIVDHGDLEICSVVVALHVPYCYEGCEN